MRRILVAIAALTFLSISQLYAQAAQAPSTRGGASRVLPPPPVSPRGTASQRATAPGTTRGAAPGAAAQAAANPIPGVYLVTFRVGMLAAEKATVVQGLGARLRGSYIAGNVVTVDVPDAATLERLRNDVRILGVFTNQRIFIAEDNPGLVVKPKPPENLTANAASWNLINLSWADVASNESGFAIERCAGSDCANFSEIFRTGSNVVTFADAGRTAQTIYRYRVAAFNVSGNSTYSNVASATTPVEPPPTAPSDLTATPVSQTQVNLSWTDNSGSESGFRIERCTGAGCSSFADFDIVGPNVVTYSDSGGSPSTTYRYRVLAFNAGGNSAYSNIANATTLPPPSPSAPSGLAATPSSHTQIDLSWTDNSTSEEGFKIERCTGSGCLNFAEVIAVGPNVASYSDPGRAPSTEYRYRVLAFNSGGNSAYSNIADATTLPPPPPTAPSELVAIPISHTQIALSWTDNSTSEDGFRVERCTGPVCTNFTEIQAFGPNVIAHSDSGLLPSTAYRYRVLAFNTGGSSVSSNIATATTLATPAPAAPSSLTATPTSSTQVNLSWTDNANNEDGFKIDRCTGSVCTNFVQITTVGANVAGFSDSGRLPSTDYRYRVLAFNTGGNSAYSNIADVTTLPPPSPEAPSALIATPVSSTHVNLSWTDNSINEDGFRIERCTGPACTNFLEFVSLGADTVSFSDLGRSASTDYRYRVRAFNNGGNSAYSNIANATTPAAPPSVPDAPSNLIAIAPVFNRVELSWTDNSNNEYGFRIERCAGPMSSCDNFVQIAEVSFDVTAYSDLGVQGQRTYTYRVRAFNANGNSAYSNSAQVTTPNTPPSAQVVPAGVQRIGAAPGTFPWTGAGIGVAVIDTGLDFAHADLDLPPENPGENSFHANAPGSTCQDIHGHGTHVAGIIGAKNNLIDVIGVAPNSAVYCVNVFENDEGQGVSATDESVIAGLNWVLTQANAVIPPIRVVNMSLGREKTIEDDDPSHPLRLAVRALYNAGITVVVAAGNDPLIEVKDQVPAFYPEVIAVASSTAEAGVNGYDSNFPACSGQHPIKADTASHFTTDGRFVSGTGVTISAPGGTREDMFEFLGSCFLEPIGILSLLSGGETVELSGTSMASPHVAGVVALMWQKEMNLQLSLSPETARTRIRDNAVRRGTAPIDSPLEEYTFDGEREGIIWAPSALLEAPPPPVDAAPTVTVSDPANNASFPHGTPITFTATATDPEDGDIASSLSWNSDLDGAIGAGATFTSELSSGNHVISASVTDSAGNVSGASVSISVGSPSMPTTVRATSVTYAMVGNDLRYTVKIEDEFGGPVAGAMVRVSLYEWVYTGNLWLANGVTDTQGIVHLYLLNADFGCYTADVYDVVASGLEWIKGTPSNNYCRL